LHIIIFAVTPTTNVSASKTHRGKRPVRPPGPPARFAIDSGSLRPAAPRRDNWLRTVTASTLDSESSDRGSNPRGAFPDRDNCGRPHAPPIIFRREIASGSATAKCAPCNFGVVAPFCWQHITSSVGTVVILVILARRSRWPQGSIPDGRMFLRGARPLRAQRVAVALVRAPQLGGRLGIPSLEPHAMGPRGPEARAHLSGPTQMGKPSAPMRGGPASRAASGGEHGGAAQKKS
jgi:hypothetical protein